MHHFVQFNRKTGEISGYLRSSTLEFLPKPASEDHEHIEIREPQQIELAEKMSPRGARLKGKVEGGVLREMSVAPLPTLQLTSSKTELEGDGNDSTVIAIQAVDESGKPLRDFDQRVRVTTERGKLSARGGVVTLVKGKGEIELTAGRETVRRVIVRVEPLDADAMRSELRLEFV